VSLRTLNAPPAIFGICHSPQSPQQYKSNRLSPSLPSPVCHLYSSLIHSAAEPAVRPGRGPKPRSDEIRWQDLLDKFRSVQLRHEKARSRQLLPRSPHIEPVPQTPSQRRNVSQQREQPAPPTPATHKRGARSIHSLTQGIMNVGRHEGKKAGKK